MLRYLLYLLVMVGMVYGYEISYSTQEIQYLENKKTITMCVDPDWEPFEIINKKQQHEGIAADIINLLKQRGKLDIQLIVTKSWDESLEFSKTRKCDLLSFLNDTPKRREWLTFTKPIFNDPNVLVGRAERNYIEDISKVQLSIALPRGTAMAERFENDFPNLTIIPTTTEAQAFKLVEDRKADITLRSLIVTAYTIKKEGLFNLKIVGEPKGYENYLRIGVRNDEPILKEILNKSIATLNKNDIDTIVNKHVSIVIEKVTNFTIALWIFIALFIITCLVLLWNFLLKKQVAQEVEKNNLQQKKLIETARKAEISELLANISHQWKNGLTQISSLNLEMRLMCQIQEKIDKDLFMQRLTSIEKSINFMSDTMNMFLNFYKEEQQYGSWLVKSNIEQVLKLIDIRVKNLKTQIDIVENYPFEITGDSNQWMHVWLNLLSNTMAAYEHNQNNNERLQITIIIDQNKIIYKDTAGGIDETLLNNIEQFQHKGLGLKMTKDILSKYGFTFNIQNHDNGTIFEIFH